MSEMPKSKRSAVIASLREGKFSDFKNSQPLIDKIRKQREETFAIKCSTLIAKQQDLVRDLDEKNLRLVEENDRLRTKSREATDQIVALNSINQE